MNTTKYPGIGTTKTLPTANLTTFHANPRRGDVEAIADSLLNQGQFRPIVVNKGTHTERPYEVLAGNHTLLAIRSLAARHPDDERWQNVDTYLVDVDNDRATKIVLADNRTSELGTIDNDTLLDVLDTLNGDYTGTGYDQNYIGALLGEYTPDDWQPDNPLTDTELIAALHYLATTLTGPVTITAPNDPTLPDAAKAAGWKTRGHTYTIPEH